MTESVKQQEVPQNLLEKAQYQTVYAYSYKSRPLIKPAKLYDGVSHGIGKPFFTAVPLKLQNDYFPLSPVNFGHRLTTSALWNQPFLPIKDDKMYVVYDVSH
jgi:hypothetical protein